MTNGLGGRTNGMTNGLAKGMGGRTNGLGGRTNGLTNGMGGRTNGLTNGLGGRTNGLTNGMGGRTNGLTNGMGRTNGMTNGLDSGAGIHRRRLNNSGISPSRISLVLIIAFIIMVPASFFLLAYDDPAYSGIRVDGDFTDWDESLILGDAHTYPDANLNIIETSVETNEAGNLFMYARAGSSWFSSQNADSLFVFIDSDDNPATGYSVRNMGAEYAVEVWGWDNAIQGRQFGVFGGNDQHNYSAWNWRSVTATMSADRMEIGIPGSAITFGQGHAILFMTKRGDTVADVCDAAISLDKPAIVVKQVPKDTSGIITTDNIMSLDITAQGTAVDVTEIGFFSNSGTPAVTGLPATIAAGQTVTLQVNLPLSSIANGTFLDVSVTSVSSTGKATILGTGFTAYAKAAPNRILIDGAFGDWNAVSKATDPAGDITNPNTDITSHAAVNGSANAYFYLKMDNSGKLLGGSNVPSARVRSTSSEPVEPVEPTPPAPLKKVSGEDILRIYIDTKNGGQSIGGIAADYMVEIKGRNGEITSQKLYSLPLTFIANIDAAKGGNQLEAGVSLSSIGFTGTLSYFMESTDWKGGEDRTAIAGISFIGGTRSSMPETTPLAGTLSYSEIPRITTNTITINGQWSMSEWTGAEKFDGNRFDMYVFHDGTYIFIAFNVTSDSLSSASDYCEIYFDKSNDKINGVPDANDRKYIAADTTVESTMIAYDGSDGNWDNTVSTSGDADGALATYDVSYIHYEFKIPLSEVFETTTSGSKVGFAAHVRDENAPGDYYWGNVANEDTAIDPLNLSTWGTLEIPEFHMMLFPILGMVGIVYISRKRRYHHG